jgi:AraC-like DNA-binding protein
MALNDISGYSGFEPILLGCTVENVSPGARARVSVSRSRYIIECNEDGYGTVTVNGRLIEIAPRICYVVHAGTSAVYTSDKERPRRGIFASIGGVRVGQILTQAGITEESPMISPEHYGEVRRILYEMHSMRAERDGGAEFRRTGLVYELLGVISRTGSAPDTEAWVRRAVGIFETVYNTPVSVGDIAELVGYERTYFSTLFKEHTGMSPYEYLTALRIEKACLLLSEGAPIGETAESVGLDARNFARVFTEVKGESPSAYKKKVSKV